MKNTRFKNKRIKNQNYIKLYLQRQINNNKTIVYIVQWKNNKIN